MKKAAFNKFNLLLLLLFVLAAPGLQAAETTPAAAPEALMPETVYEFPDTVDGDYVVHDFTIRNQGDAVLNVLEVKTT